jgi:Tfp pilus assembly protein PilN
VLWIEFLIGPQLQRSISDKDSAIAILELQQSSEDVCAQRLERLKRERGKLTQQLKGKVQERVDLFRKDSDKALESLANQFHSYNKKQASTIVYCNT